MTQELGQTELMVVLPQPVSRHMILKSPISPSEVEGKIMLSPKQKEEKVQELLKEMFPDATMKYQIVAIAADCQPHFKVGAFVSFTQSGNSRPHQMINNGDYMLVSEGDIGLIWTVDSLEYNKLKYKKEEQFA